MNCFKTGVPAVWTGSHCYAGDCFRCMGCGTEILVTSDLSYHNEKALQNPKAINMDDWEEQL